MKTFKVKVPRVKELGVLSRLPDALPVSGSLLRLARLLA